MRHTVSFLIFSLFCGVLCAGDIGVSKIFSRATNGQNGAVFLRLENTSSNDVKLIKAESDASNTVELHNHIKEGDVFRMRQVDTIDIPANAVAELKPGGLHVMLMGLKNPLIEGEAFNVTLLFDTGETQEIRVPIGKPGQMSGCCCHCKKGKK